MKNTLYSGVYGFCIFVITIFKSLFWFAANGYPGKAEKTTHSPAVHVKPQVFALGFMGNWKGLLFGGFRIKGFKPLAFPQANAPRLLNTEAIGCGRWKDERASRKRGWLLSYKGKSAFQLQERTWEDVGNVGGCEGMWGDVRGLENLLALLNGSSKECDRKVAERLTSRWLVIMPVTGKFPTRNIHSKTDTLKFQYNS